MYPSPMPYRTAPAPGRCIHCNALTAQACVACAHPVCPDDEQRHDATFPHKTYEG